MANLAFWLLAEYDHQIVLSGIAGGDDYLVKPIEFRSSR